MGVVTWVVHQTVGAKRHEALGDGAEVLDRKRMVEALCEGWVLELKIVANFDGEHLVVNGLEHNKIKIRSNSNSKLAVLG